MVSSFWLGRQVRNPFLCALVRGPKIDEEASYYMGNFFPANKNGRVKFSFRGKKVSPGSVRVAALKSLVLRRCCSLPTLNHILQNPTCRTGILKTIHHQLNLTVSKAGFDTTDKIHGQTPQHGTIAGAAAHQESGFRGYSRAEGVWFH